MDYFNVSISDTSKDGDIVKFTVITKINESDQSECGKIVVRQYEDFEYLLHTLTIQTDINAVIIPALPPKPVVLPTNFDSKLKMPFSATSGMVSCDNYILDGLRFEKFLQDLVIHPSFRKEEVLVKFLTEEKPAVRTIVKRGLMHSFSNLVDFARYQNYKDIDDEFQSRRDLTNNILLNMKQCHTAIVKMKSGENDCWQYYGDIATACRNVATHNVQNSEDISRFLGRFADVLEDLMVQNGLSTSGMEKSFGFSIEVYSRYIVACQEMLFRRTCRLVKLDNATKALEKATSKNREQLLTAKEEASQTFEEVSHQAKLEFDNFNNSRINFFRQCMVDLANRKIKIHEASRGIVCSALNELKASV